MKIMAWFKSYFERRFCKCHGCRVHGGYCCEKA